VVDGLCGGICGNCKFTGNVCLFVSVIRSGGIDCIDCIDGIGNGGNDFNGLCGGICGNCKFTGNVCLFVFVIRSGGIDCIDCILTTDILIIINLLSHRNVNAAEIVFITFIICIYYSY
jgi:hypothetical protein